MNYKDAVHQIETISQDAQFLAITFDDSDNHFYTYLISGNVDEKEGLSIGCHIEGGILFDTSGVEDYQDIDEAVPTISKLHFKPFDESLNIMGMVAEYVLFQLFPMLQDPKSILSKSDERKFLNLAKHHIEHTWKE